MSCKSCYSSDLFIDDTCGMQVCNACGIVQDLSNFDAQIGGITGPQGSYVRVGTVGVGTDYTYRERKLFQSDSIIKRITFGLNFTESRTAEVKDMIDKVTAGEFGLENWFNVLVGACSCIVMRIANKPLPMSEVAAAVGCDLYEMGRMINRVVQFLGLQLPEFDIVGMLERLIRNFRLFQGAGAEKIETMVKQGNFILQCTIKWFLTTGRRPGPVAVAVLVFVAKLNGVEVKIEEAAKEANTAIHTCKKRYGELVDVLVKVAQKLPWGKDVNAKNILKNAPFVLKYMEMKSMEKEGTKRKRIGDDADDAMNSSLDMEELLVECVGGASEYGAEWKVDAIGNDPLQSRSIDAKASLSMSELQNLRISQETLSQIYSKFNTGASMIKLTERGESSCVRNGQDWCYDSSNYLFEEWWTGRSDLCRRLMVEEITETDVGLEVLPPSYIRGYQQAERRKQKIKAAKARIRATAFPPQSKALMCNADDASISEQGNGKGKRRKTKDQDFDREDFIIETLLLHQVKDEEIAKGHYNTLLDLHVFNSGAL